MSARFILPVICFLMASPTVADELAGSWRLQTKDIASGRGCTLEGALVLKETAGATSCSLTLVQQCAGVKNHHLIVEETCEYARKGDDVTIKGTDYKIIEAVPRGAWSQAYMLDTFNVTIAPGGREMKGRFRGYGQAQVTLSRMKDLAQ